MILDHSYYVEHNQNIPHVNVNQQVIAVPPENENNSSMLNVNQLRGTNFEF